MAEKTKEDIHMDEADEEDSSAAASLKAADSKDSSATGTPPAVAKKKSKSKSPTDTRENGEKNAKDGPTKSASAKKKSPTKSPSKGTSKSYIQLVHEAIVELKDRTGSSLPAIMKYLQKKYTTLYDNTPQNRFKQHVMGALKSGVKQGRFDKVKASYKIGSEWKKKEANARKRKKQQELKKKKDREKEKKRQQEIKQQQQKDPLQAKIDALREKNPDSEELKKLIAEKKRKEEEEARKKYIAERLKKRRFPMDDTKLHAEDKELGVKPPKDVIRRPDLPNFFSLTQNDERRSNKAYAATASKCENPEKGNRGLVSDLLQVYHFFRGDVHYTGAGDHSTEREIVPPFTLKQLIHAVDDVLNGTAKKARMVPPLIVHLFVTCLQILTAPPDSDDASADDTSKRRQLQQDFATHLSVALSPTSWADVCFMYMDAVDRHMITDASLEKNVLPGMPIDADYLLELKEEESEITLPALPIGYGGYLGDEEGLLKRAQEKLERLDPWLLTAEDLMALLRALTDDILARKQEIGEDISYREEKMYELLKAKKAADAKFRKLRLAYEGPKKPKKPSADSSKVEENNEKIHKVEKDKKEDSDDGSAEDSNRKSLDGNHEEDGQKEKGEKAKIEEEWKPTATKKQFEAAKKAQIKASEAYEKGVRKLMARTEPVGYDRNYNAVYCFRHDPDVLYVEMFKPPPVSDNGLPEDMQLNKTSWHVIETKSLFDQFVQSLDIRGKRENALYEELMGPQGAQQSLRRFLYDDIREKAEANARLKEKEDLKWRLENARLKCDEEEGRRSGRLASRAEEELAEIEDEINKLEQKIKSGGISKELDYEELTGLALLRKYDSVGKMETRRTREKKAVATENNIEPMYCSKLCSTGNIDGTGVMGLLVSKMLELEETCNFLAPWDREDVSRKTWISELENLIYAWNSASPVLVGPADATALQASPRPTNDSMTITPSPLASENSRSSKKRPSTGFGSTDSKRSKTESSSSTFPVSQAVAKLRQPLLELEKRVFEITGLAMAAKDTAEADDNMSAREDDDAVKESKEKRAWKKLINKLHSLPSKRHNMIREIVVDAISAARKAQLKGVVGQLRTALLEFHPNAAGACKAAALKVLEANGGYEVEDDEEEDEEEEEELNEESPEGDEAETPSALSAEAVIVNGSLDGIEDASHVDWVGAVKSARTLSRMATLITAFVKRATEKLFKIQQENDALMQALAVWEKNEERRLRNQSKSQGDSAKSKATPEGPSEVWAHVDFTDEICMAKAEAYPWWPAKKCIAKDPNLAASLKSVGRCLVSLLGESGAIRVVESSAVRPYTGKEVEEEEDVARSEISKEMKMQLDECMAMARRILRGRSGKKSSGKGVLEEKKIAT